jgi:PrtD family type I secretion system ABC transporter
MADRTHNSPRDPARSSTPIDNVVRRLRKIIGASIIFSFAVNLIILISPLYMMQIYNRVLPSRSESTLIMLTALVFFALAALAVLEAVRSLVFVRIGGAVERDLNEIVIDSSFQTMLQNYSTTYDHALRDFDTIRTFVWSNMPSNLLDMLWVPLFVACVFLLHPVLGLIALGGAVALVTFGVVHNIVTRRSLQEAGRLSRGLSGVVERSLRHGQTLQAMGMLEHFKRRWIRERGQLIELQARAADRSGIFGGVTKSTRILLQTVLLAAGAMLAINDEVSAGVIVAASMLMSRALAPVEATIGGWRQCLAAHGAFGRLTQLLAASPEPAPRMRLPAPRGALQLEDVVVWPDGCSEPTLRKVSFSLAPGEVLGVVGGSGSGKSTLARVAIGAWRPHSGKVRLDGAEIDSYGRQDLGPFLGYLPQEVELFEGTVAENIARFGDLDAISVVEAARRSGVHEMILGLPNGYETQLGPQGCVLSGGQRQRIGLARAIYLTPVLVVLDEPNANLDSAGEEALIGAVETLKGLGSTVILISHRPKVLRDVDHLLMLKAGAPALMKSRADLQLDLGNRVRAKTPPLRWAEAR